MSEFLAADPELVKKVLQELVTEYDLVEELASGIDDILPPPSINPDITSDDIAEQW